jgi:hypothetical protein
MTIEKARKILKLNEQDHSDEEILRIMSFTNFLVDACYDKLKKKYTDEDFLESNLKTNKKKIKRINLFTSLSYNSDEDKSKNTDKTLSNES